jgi:hypothetical protein
VLALDPDGIFLSNVLAIQQRSVRAHKAVHDLMGKKPIFGFVSAIKFSASRSADRHSN